MINKLQPSSQPPWAIAHRGFSRNFPENTWPAFEAALAEPIRAIELDIQFTADGVAVIFHDRTLKRLGGGSKSVADLSLEELRHFDFGAWFSPAFRGQAVPLLERVLERLGPRIPLLLEFKSYGRNKRSLFVQMAELVAMIRRQGLQHRCAILCFDLALLRHGYELDPSLAFVWNQDVPRFFAREEFLFAYSVRISRLNRAFVARAHAAGKPVLTFTCNDQALLRHALACGVDAVMSDNPRWLAEALQNTARKST